MQNRTYAQLLNTIEALAGVDSFESSSEEGVDERGHGRTLGQDDQGAQENQDDDDGHQPELLAHLQECPQVFQ